MYEVEELLIKNSLFAHKWIEVKQTPNHTPFRLMICGGKTQRDVERKTIIIKNNDTYSNEFIELLKDYYLYL